MNQKLQVSLTVFGSNMGLWIFSAHRKLSYRIDSVRRRSCLRSTPFKVTDFSINRKHVCDFLFENNTNFPPILHCFPVIAQY